MRPSSKRRTIAGLAAATAALFVIGWLAWPRVAGFQVAGGSARTYFSPWRRPNFTPGPPAALGSTLSAEEVPVLIEALGRVDSGSHRQAIRLWTRMPPFLRRKLPEPIPAGDVHLGALAALRSAMSSSSATRPINRAVAAEFARVPAGFRLEVLESLGSDPSASDAVIPVLLQVVRGTNVHEQVVAGESLLGLEGHSSNSIAALVAYLTPLAKRPQELPNAWPGLCRQFGRLGPAARAALPMLRELADHSLPEIRAEAALACWRIEPAGRNAGAFLEQELGRLGTRGTFVLVAAWSAEASTLQIPAGEALPVLARLIERGSQAGRAPGRRPPTESVLYLTDERYTPRRIHYPAGYPDVLTRALACDLAGSYGAAARDLGPQLRTASQHPEPAVRESARRALLRIGADEARNH